MRYINLKYPLQESPEGFFLDSTTTTGEQVKSALALLLTTTKGNVRYKPNFGTDLSQYLFQPLDSITKKEIKDNLEKTVKDNLNNVTIKSIVFVENQETQLIGVDVEFEVTDGVLKQRDSLSLVF